MGELQMDDYSQYAALCECGMRIVLARVENLRQEATISGERSPYAAIQSRIKSFDSIEEKCNRKGLPFTIEGMRKLHDIAGIRIITLYEDDIYRIRDALVRQPSMELIEERDYVKNPKENGYRSLHLIVTPSAEAPKMFAEIARILEDFDSNAMRIRDASIGSSN